MPKSFLANESIENNRVKMIRMTSLEQKKNIRRNRNRPKSTTRKRRRKRRRKKKRKRRSPRRTNRVKRPRKELGKTLQQRQKMIVIMKKR